MKIHLLDNYYLRSDKHNYMVCRFQGKDKRGLDQWDPLSFHSTVDAALHRFTEFHVRTAEIESFAELKTTLHEMRALLGSINKQLQEA